MILTLEEAARFVEALRAENKTVVFTNGVFHLLDPGPVR